MPGKPKPGALGDHKGDMLTVWRRRCVELEEECQDWERDYWQLAEQYRTLHSQHLQLLSKAASTSH